MTATTDTPTVQELLAERDKTAAEMANLSADFRALGVEIAELRPLVHEIGERVHLLLGDEVQS
jgi:hypothetical protein